MFSLGERLVHKPPTDAEELFKAEVAQTTADFDHPILGGDGSVGVKKQQWEAASAQMLAAMAEMRGLREYLRAGIDFGIRAAAANAEQAAVDAEARKKELAEAQTLSQSVPIPVPPPTPTPPPSYPPTFKTTACAERSSITGG